MAQDHTNKEKANQELQQVEEGDGKADSPSVKRSTDWAFILMDGTLQHALNNHWSDYE